MVVPVKCKHVQVLSWIIEHRYSADWW